MGLDGVPFHPHLQWGEKLNLREGLGVVGAVYSTSCVLYDSQNTTAKHAAAALTTEQRTRHDKSVLAAFTANPCQLPRICR